MAVTPLESQRRHVALRVGQVRIVISLVALVLMPAMQPEITPYLWLIGAYLLCAVGAQAMIWKQRGGRIRLVGMGIVDLATVLFFSQRLGTMTPLPIALLLFINSLYAIAIPLRMARGFALGAAAVFVGVVWAETLGWIPYAPDAPVWIHYPGPSPEEAIGATMLTPLLLFGAVNLVGRLVQEIRHREAELERMTQRDPLTQLFNVRFLNDRMATELARVGRGQKLTVMLVDLDGFKHINDEQGHRVGDELLVEVGHALRGATRQVDVVGRYGGDEFVILLPDTDEAGARAVAQRLVDAAREVGRRFDPERPVTASVGVAAARAGERVESLLRRADLQSYHAKNAGGDRFEDATMTAA